MLLTLTSHAINITIPIIIQTTIIPSPVCQGTSYLPEHTLERFQQYRQIYTKCTHVEGNLEIVFLDHPHLYPLDFLSTIEEISGYLLILGNYMDLIPLKNLKVIRGQSLFKHQDHFYSLYIALNYDPDQKDIGLKELQFVSLKGGHLVFQFSFYVKYCSTTFNF